MTARNPWDRLANRLTVTPLVALLIALSLLAVSVTLALYNERAGLAASARQAQVQADILAGSVTASLAFDDRVATQEYVNALRANPAIRAAGVYDARGQLAAGFRRGDAGPPAAIKVGAPDFDAGSLSVTSRVSEGSLPLGSVYLRLGTDSLGQRALRYVGIGGIVLMASLLVAVLGSSAARLREANEKLQRETAVRQRAEAALRQAQKMEAMGQLTGGVAHDFNNLLMVASSGLDLLDRTNDPVRRERLKGGIRQAIDRGASLTQQLLAFARKAPVRPEVIDLGQSLRAMQDMLERSLREDISIALEVEDGLWPVEVDPSQLEVAVLNMCINARDAMPGGGAIRIVAQNLAADAENTRDQVRLCVIDVGVGMDPELAWRVFEPFFTTKDVGKGTGLGLSQVYGFARSSGGDVRFESALGEGATVSIDLPRTSKPAPVLAAASEAGSSGQGRRILLVEDDDSVADLVGEMLTELGHEVVRVAQAEAALAHLEQDSAFEVVFSDMVMPGDMDGLALAHEVGRRWPGMALLLTTGYSSAAASAATEGVRLLVKPYRIEALAAELSAALATKRADRSA